MKIYKDFVEWFNDLPGDVRLDVSSSEKEAGELIFEAGRNARQAELIFEAGRKARRAELIAKIARIIELENQIAEYEKVLKYYSLIEGDSRCRFDDCGIQAKEVLEKYERT